MYYVWIMFMYEAAAISAGPGRDGQGAEGCVCVFVREYTDTDVSTSLNL